jgi:hypothetical protein
MDLKCGQYTGPPVIQPSLMAEGGGEDQNLDHCIIT